MGNKIRKWLLKKLWLRWISYDDGRELRGTGQLEKIEKKLFSK